ncbi:hypothetical protein [Protofrankia coriariae]|nr:hypothetical protein [Protofrankia coriariae]
MNRRTENRLNLVIAWCGPAFVLGYIIFWAVFGHNVPPPNMMGLSGEELVARYYGPHHQSIAIGMAVSMSVAFLYLPWCCLLSGVINDSERGPNVLSRMELAGGALTAWSLGFCPGLWLLNAILVHDLDPSVIKAFHVFGWFTYDMTYGITTVQCVGVGLWTVLNKKQKIFPAWAGWATIAVGSIFVTLVVLPWIKEGPFTVAGTWNFFVIFSSWLFAFFALYSFFLIREMSRRKSEFEEPAPTGELTPTTDPGIPVRA